MARPTSSVIINNFNYGRFVGEAVASALAQTETDREIIVVDDGSTDESRDVLRRFDSQIRLILRSNGGQAAALNEGVRASRGTVLCFLDADDGWHPQKLASIAAAFRAKSRTGLVYHRLQPMRDGKPALRPVPRTLCSGDLSRRLARSAGWWPFPMTSAISVRRATWDLAGDIPESFRLSADAWLTGAYPFVCDVAGLQASLGFYRLHRNGWYRDSDDAAMLRRRTRHWEASVEAVNGFLAGRHSPYRLNLSDHLPHRLAMAQLDGIDMGGQLSLLRDGLSFAGEPNALRRLRDALRAVWRLHHANARPATPRAAE